MPSTRPVTYCVRAFSGKPANACPVMNAPGRRTPCARTSSPAIASIALRKTAFRIRRIGILPKGCLAAFLENKCARAQDDHLARPAFASGIVRCFGEEYVLDAGDVVEDAGSTRYCPTHRKCAVVFGRVCGRRPI